ncbi:hypothetical protein, conserved [Eimeria acervulina]|uniref:Origin recognition complex subunit 4 n=1 Tax=Eimeria acervulina TaxID=5801 RepID=U6GB70_EIMAC|nr:hypothetical protein, conserved [Eimeria acervulina]CDI77390.1 hypothetical protein, conserved [Eimeria acervulina]
MQGPPAPKRLRAPSDCPPPPHKRRCSAQSPEEGLIDSVEGPLSGTEGPPAPTEGPLGSNGGPLGSVEASPGVGVRVGVDNAERSSFAAAGGPQEEATTRPLPFSQVMYDRLSSGAYLLQLLQHVLRQRLRAALRGELHKITLGAPKTQQKKQSGFIPSPAVESLLRGESAAAASLRARSSGSSSNSSSDASVEGVAGALAAKLMCCLQLKEKSSVLVMGPRGSGATTAVECALRFVQQQQQQQQEQQQLRRLLVVRVNCSLYGSDTEILQGIVRRLCSCLGQQQLLQQQELQQQGSSFGDWARRLRSLLIDSCVALGFAVVVVLDRAEVCCLSSRERSSSSGALQQQQQLLLYTLFDLQHGEGLHIFTLCLSPVADLPDFMEKRIRSRFTMQKLLLSAAAATPQQLLGFIRNNLLSVQPQDLLLQQQEAQPLPAAAGAAADAAADSAAKQKDKQIASRFIQSFNAALDKELSDPSFIAACGRALALGRNPRCFLVAAVRPLLLLSPPLPQLAAAASRAALGAPEAPEALSPIHSPLRHAEQQRSACREGAAAAELEQQQQQQQEEERLKICADAINPRKVSRASSSSSSSRSSKNSNDKGDKSRSSSSRPAPLTPHACAC